MSDELPSSEEQHKAEKVDPNPGADVEHLLSQVRPVADQVSVAAEPAGGRPHQAERGGERKKGFVRRRDKPAVAIALVVCLATVVQVGVTTCNNKSSGDQTDKLIGYAKASSDAATRSAAAAAKSEAAAEKSAQASRDFADSSNRINTGISNAVAKLGEQAASTHLQAEGFCRNKAARTLQGRDSRASYAAKE